MLKHAKKKSRMHERDNASDNLEFARGYSSKIDTKALIKTGPMGRAGLLLMFPSNTRLEEV